ncbi:hypothetical protein LguiA_017721 [Lonicera macranthoides]
MAREMLSMAYTWHHSEMPLRRLAFSFSQPLQSVRRKPSDPSPLINKIIIKHTQANLVRYAEKHKTELLEAGSSSSSTAPSQPDPSSWAPKRGPSNWSSKPKSKPKREKTEEEKKFRRRAKYFLVTEMVAVLVFLSLVARSDDSEVDLDDEEGLNYND